MPLPASITPAIFTPSTLVPLAQGQYVGPAELAHLLAVLLEPVQAELRVGDEVVFSQEAADQLQCGLDGHRRAVIQPLDDVPSVVFVWDCLKA